MSGAVLITTGLISTGLLRRIGGMLVTHDLAVVGEVSDDVLVMYRGRVVEHRPTADVLRRPEHAYTEMLLSSAPRPGWEPERVVELRAAFAGA